eukprot:4891799-Lingulodinium_polyedra.AAC.1
MVVGPGGMAARSASSSAMRSAQLSATTELAPCGMIQVRVSRLVHPCSLPSQAIAAPAATLWPPMLREPPSK